MNIERLIRTFEDFDTRELHDYKELISSKHNNEIFPPYIPHIGQKYGDYRLMMYGMAQNIDKPWPELIDKSKTEKVRQMYDSENFACMWIAPYRIMLAVAGIYIYAKHRKAIESFQEIHGCIAATNYYKFSLNKGGRDINPNRDLKKYNVPQLYWRKNDELSAEELECLKPRTILSFRGRHVKAIKDVVSKMGGDSIAIEEINDPAWILRGGGGLLKKGRGWDRAVDDKGIYKLVNSYIDQIDDKYSGKKEAVKIYLIKYYSDWAGEN